MDIKWILLRIKNIISKPVLEWLVIANDNDDYKAVLRNYALPLIVLVSVARFLGLSKFGINLSFYAILYAIVDFLSLYFGMYISALIIKEVAPSFLSDNDKTVAFKIIIYSSTPIFVASFISNLASSLFFVNLFYIYTLYLLWSGIGPLMNTPERNKMSFIIIIVIVLFATTEAIDKILTSLLPVSGTISV